MRRYLLAGLFCLAGPVAAMDCSGDPQFNARSIFHVVSNPVQVFYFHEYNTAQIENMRHMHFHNKLVHNPGVTLAEPDLKVDYQIGGLEHPRRDGYCVWVESVNVSFSYDKLNVFVSSQYPVGSCPYQVILNHENQHVAIDQRLLAKYRALMERALLASKIIPTRRHPMSVVSMNNGKAIISQRLNGIVDRLLADYKREVTKENGKLDTPANYKRTQALCNNW